MRPVRRARAGVLVVLVALLLGTSAAFAAGAATPASRTTPTSSAETLDWQGCGSGFQCATLTVPRDGSAPESTLDLSVIRARARDAVHKIGTLVVNPGGPGVPAVQFLRSAASTLPSDVRDRFDLV